MTHLTDTQRRLLEAAAHHPDRLLVPPPSSRGGAIARVAAALLARGLAAEVTVGPDVPAWRSEADGRRIGLRQVAGIGHPESDEGRGAGDARGADEPPPTPEGTEPAAASQPPGDASAVPRSWTKAAIVRALLAREHGASLAEITAATGWLPHSARAALTRLRRGEPALTRSRSPEDGHSRYRLHPATSSEKKG